MVMNNMNARLKWSCQLWQPAATVDFIIDFKVRNQTYLLYNQATHAMLNNITGVCRLIGQDH